MNTNNHDSIASIFLGFILAVGNSIFGWFSHYFCLIQNSFLNTSAQAIVTGIIGATTAYFTNKFWKYIEKKYKSKHSKHEQL
jgi:hypothetical protein